MPTTKHSITVIVEEAILDGLGRLQLTRHGLLVHVLRLEGVLVNWDLGYVGALSGQHQLPRQDVFLCLWS